MNTSHLFSGFCASVMAIGLSTGAHAALIFNQTQTGAQLFSNTAVSFPNSPANTSNPTVSGSALDFVNTTNSQLPVLMRWDLLAAGTRGDLTIDIDVDYSNPGGGSDNDPMFAIQAGSNYFGLFRADNNGGSIFGVEGPINTIQVPGSASATTTTLIFSGLGAIDPMAWTLSILDAASGPQQISNFNEGADSVAGPFLFSNNLLNTDDALSFVLLGNNFNSGDAEEYRIHSVSVSIDDVSVVPVPAVIWLFAPALIGLVGIARTREKRQDKT